jgi:hypothetical protein
MGPRTSAIGGSKTVSIDPKVFEEQDQRDVKNERTNGNNTFVRDQPVPLGQNGWVNWFSRMLLYDFYNIK